MSVFSICGFHDSGEKAQQLMKEFFLFNLIGLSKTSPLGMATLSWTSSFRLPLIAVLFGPGRIVMDVLFQWYGRIDATWYVTPATQLLSNPQPCFVGTAPSSGRPGWSNKGYPRGRHARALVKALADSLLGFWPRCPLSVGLSREHLFGLESTWLGSAPNLVGFWSACPPSVCPAPECL